MIVSPLVRSEVRGRTLVVGSLERVNKMGGCTVWKSGSSIGTEGVHFTDRASGITVNWLSCQYFLVVDCHWPVGTLLSDEDNL